MTLDKVTRVMSTALVAELSKDFDTYLTWSQSGKVANQY